MRKKRLPVRIVILFLPLLFLASFSFAQKRTVSGKITDSKDGSPLVGVSVIPAGSKVGTTTGSDGSFTLSVDNNVHTLIISSIGFLTKQVPIEGDNMAVSLTASSAALNEVVVIGYGTARKKDLTGSVVTVNAKDFQQGAIASPDQLIAGKVAGVVVTSNGGAPGSGSTIRIRGGSSLNASNDPLYVIDGVPLSNDGIAGSPNPLSLINPNDIESETVLKDASATAIYGNRASNGVIIITTKRGRGNGPLKISFSSVNSISEKANEVKVLNANQVRQAVDSFGTTSQQALLGTANTNWQDQIYQSAFSTDNNISLSGGIHALPYRLSLGYLSADGILKTNNLQRTSLRFNVSPYLLNNSLHIDINVMGSSNSNRFANQGAIGGALSMDPTQPVYAKNNYGGYWEWLDPVSGAPIQQAVKNPLGQLELYKSTSTVQKAIGNIQLDYKIPWVPGLRANMNGALDVSQGIGDVYIPDSVAMDYAQGGYANHYTQYLRNELFDFYLNYVKDITSIKSHIDATAGYEYQDFYNDNPGTPQTNAAKTVLINLPADNTTEHTLVSFYGRLNYTYNEKYLLTATLRADGSSRFSSNNRWGYFPSVALAWRIKQEDFLKNSDAVSDLKLRIGYGLTGQENIGPVYPYLPLYTYSTGTGRYPFGDSSYYTYRAEPYDPNIKWENTATFNVGLDYGFVNGKIYGSIDVYDRKTSNLLVDIPTSAGANLSNHVYTNVGNLENKGVEFAINAVPVNNKKFNWTLGFNIAYNDNKITKLSKTATDTSAGYLTGNIGGGTGNSIQIISVGYPNYTFYVYKQVYDQNGKPIEGVYDDINKNPSNLFYRYKSGAPTVTLGFSTQFNYANWSLSFVLRGDFGNYVYNNVAAGGTLNSILTNFPFINNANASYLKTGFVNSQYYSDYYVENASFLRMDNLALGYNFGKIIDKKVNLRLSAIAQNVFVITKYTGLDPEVFGGIDNNIYPRPRIFSLGVYLDY
ncbi:MAG TPA: TonB-dependent receptor [Puia sp.]|nr:TonB-dependent receptor [Puia sp.]